MGNIQNYLPDNSGWAPHRLTYNICGPNRASGICVHHCAKAAPPPLCTSTRLSRESLQSSTHHRSLQRLIKLHKLSSFSLVSVVHKPVKCRQPLLCVTAMLQLQLQPPLMRGELCKKWGDLFGSRNMQWTWDYKRKEKGCLVMSCKPYRISTNIVNMACTFRLAEQC